eukprot:jgi/Tetstr1/430226/TSEL_020055.t1
MGRRNSKRRIHEDKEGWTHATGTWEAATKRVHCNACGAPVSKTRFYDNHRWTEACAESPDTTARVAAGGDGDPAAPYVRHASAPSGAGQTERGASRELRELPDANSDAEGISAGLVEGNPSDDSRSDNNGVGDVVARYDFSTGTSAAVHQGASAAPANWAAYAEALDKYCHSTYGLVGVLKQQQKRAGGIIKHNTNAVKNLAATQAVPGDNVDEGSSPEPPGQEGQ